MPSGTGLNYLFGDRFPKRTFDVGIAEQLGVTFAAGLAADGMKPFAAIYSTFLQRAYRPKVAVHDVAIQKLPVRFAIDRAGLVGNDGQTHAGSFDIGYLGTLPGFVVMAAADEAELVHMVSTAVSIDDGPSALRFPRGDGVGVEMMPEFGVPLEIGRGRIVREGNLQHRAIELWRAPAGMPEEKAAQGDWPRAAFSTTVADARFAKPLDTDLITRLAREHEVVITIEEGAIGGFGSFVLHYLAGAGHLDHGLKIRSMCLLDIFIDHDSAGRYRQYRRRRAQRQAHRRHRPRRPWPRYRRAPRTGLAATPSKPKRRADQLLVDQGLAESRAKAQALILAGVVFAGDRRVDKAGATLDENTELRLAGRDHPWVSRGGPQAGACARPFRDRHGGADRARYQRLDRHEFTDVLLTRGAARVHAVDVGRGQLAWKLRQDSRVVLHDATNARYLTRAEIADPIDLVTCDASFIGLATVLPAPLSLTAQRAALVALVKPQSSRPARRGSAKAGSYATRRCTRKSAIAPPLGSAPSPDGRWWA